jgi:DNA-binding XRE family transcriptional regulator
MSKEVKNSEENLVKKTCRELGITQKELAERIGYGYSTIKSIASGNPISENLKTSISLLVRNYQLEQELKTVKEFKSNLKTFLAT